MSGAVLITDGRLTVTSHPEHGFVISSIKHAEDSRELIWRRPGRMIEPLTDPGPVGPASNSEDDPVKVGAGSSCFQPVAP
jgi:hypothetical protein